MRSSKLISPEYREWNRVKHVNEPDWGGHVRPYLAPLIAKLKFITGGQTVLNYGCGKGLLPGSVNYDPAIPVLDSPPDPADILVSTCALEHVEPDCLEAVLDDICRLSLRGCIVVVSCYKSPNGHLSVHPPSFWREQLGKRWREIDYNDHQRCRFVGLVPRSRTT